MKAWRVSARQSGDAVVTVTFAPNRGAAKAKNYLAAREAGYALGWGDFHAIRAPAYDRLLTVHGPIFIGVELADKLLWAMPPIH